MKTVTKYCMSALSHGHSPIIHIFQFWEMPNVLSKKVFPFIQKWKFSRIYYIILMTCLSGKPNHYIKNLHCRICFMYTFVTLHIFRMSWIVGCSRFFVICFALLYKGISIQGIFNKTLKQLFLKFIYLKRLVICPFTLK